MKKQHDKLLVTKIDHIAVAVKSLENALIFYTELLGFKIIHEETILHEGIRVAFIDVSGVKVELMEPLDESSFVARQIRKKGQGLAHICFSTNDIESLSDYLRKCGLVTLTENPFTGADGRKVIFVHPKDNSGTLTEFIEKIG